MVRTSRFAALGLTLLAGCTIDSTGPAGGDGAPETLLSIQRMGSGDPVRAHEIQRFQGQVLGTETTGWSFLWNADSGEIVGDSNGPYLEWRAPDLPEAWIQLQAMRGAERIEQSRRVLVEPASSIFRLDGPLDIQPPGTFLFVLERTPLGGGCELSWNCDSGTLSGDGDAVQWTVHAPGPHLVWVEETCPAIQRRAERIVTVEDLPPEIGLAPGEDHPYECGRTYFVTVRATDGNLEPATLEEATGEGLAVLSVEEAGPDPDGAWQGEWILQARMGEEAGDWPLHLRVRSGGQVVERDLHLCLEINEI